MPSNNNGGQLTFDMIKKAIDIATNKGFDPVDLILPRGLIGDNEPPGAIYSGILKKWIDPKSGEVLELKKE